MADLPTRSSLGSARVRIVGTALGTIAFCVWSRTWQDLPHVVYDVTAGVAVYSFLAQLLAEALARQTGRWWWVRAAAVVAMSVITVGREFSDWPVSGHVTCVTAVAIIQQYEFRLARQHRLAYLLPVLVAIIVRLVILDAGFATPLWAALLTGAAIAFATVAALRPKAATPLISGVAIAASSLGVARTADPAASRPYGLVTRTTSATASPRAVELGAAARIM